MVSLSNHEQALNRHSRESGNDGGGGNEARGTPSLLREGNHKGCPYETNKLNHQHGVSLL